MSEALIVIDMQNGLEDVYQRKQLINNINKRIDQYRSKRKPLVFYNTLMRICLYLVVNGLYLMICIIRPLIDTSISIGLTLFIKPG
ncbi:isochorismatase family protein [Oenococcus oeni]|uniref:isochorismatase family protein n=1 Tax=Oenococcus oeni TaxID=1247 RepID=UPI000A4FCB17